MGIKQKFFALTGLVGIILAVVSIIGYYGASNAVRDGVEQEIAAIVSEQNARIDGWLAEKGRIAKSDASLLSAISNNKELMDTKEVLLVYDDDKEVLVITHGNEHGAFVSSLNGNRTGQINPNDREWYVDLKKGKGFHFTEPYMSKTSKKLVVSACAPYNDASGKFYGGVCENITLDVLGEKVKELKYRGEGNGVIISGAGKVLASSREGIEQMSEAKDMPGIGQYIDEMKTKGSGYLNIEINGEALVFCYATVPSTGWLIGISAPDSFVFASLYSLRTTFIILIVVGVLLIMAACLTFSNKITRCVLTLNERANELANGNLRLPDIQLATSDELGNLGAAFNVMQQNLKKLISSIAHTSEQVAASAEELTAGAHQSAEAATNVAQTVVDVANGMEKQVDSVDHVKVNVDTVFSDISQMNDKTKHVADNAVQTKEVAEHGEQLMQTAVSRIESIEASVMASADVVRKLGENSQQIGQIIETISSIADQTNLLALNAAIEAARAGEAGRGFSVVAEEVRKLAEQSQTATEEIKSRIANIQQETENAVVSMQQGTTEVEQGAEAIRKVGEQFSDILNMVGSIEGQIQDINESVKTVSEGTTNIVKAVDDIDEISRATSSHTHTISAAAEEQSASSEEIASASRALADLAGDLQATTQRFKV